MQKSIRGINKNRKRLPRKLKLRWIRNIDSKLKIACENLGIDYNED